MLQIAKTKLHQLGRWGMKIFPKTTLGQPEARALVTAG